MVAGAVVLRFITLKRYKMLDQTYPKIMHVLPTMNRCGGAEQLVYKMAHSMRNNDSFPVVWCIDSLGDLALLLRKEGASVFHRKQKGSLDVGLIWWMAGIAKRENISVIHAHMYNAFEHSVPAAVLAGRISVVYTVHGRLYPEKRDFRRRLMYPLWSMGVDRFVSISEKTKESMVHYDFHPEKKIQVIHNGIEFTPKNDSSDTLGMRSSLGLDGKAPIMGTAARMEDIKNIPMMLRAFQRVLGLYPNACLLLAGDGSKLGELKTIARQMEISDNVLFLGQRSDLDVIYPLLEVFLLSSYTEGISVSLLEAMCCGIPAVVTRVGGNPEITIDGKTGFLVPSDDDALMAEKILMLLSNRAIAEELGRNGRVRALDHFSFSGMMDKYLCLYRSLCE